MDFFTIDRFILKQVDKVVDFLTEWIDLDRPRLLKGLTIAFTIAQVIPDILLHRSGWSFMFDGFLFIVCYFVSVFRTSALEQDTFSTFWRYWFLGACIGNILLGVLYHTWEYTAFEFLFYSWLLVLGSGSDAPRGKKRKALLEKINWGSWLSNLVPQT